jgi:hypothetical protein
MVIPIRTFHTSYRYAVHTFFARGDHRLLMLSIVERLELLVRVRWRRGSLGSGD